MRRQVGTPNATGLVYNLDMSGWRITYGVLVLVALIAYFMPWINTGTQLLPGWATILPFSFAYFIGLILGIVIFSTTYKPVGLTILAGILMIIGVIVTGALIGFTSAASGSSQFGGGFSIALIVSLVYVILGPIAGNKFKKANIVIETK